MHGSLSDFFPRKRAFPSSSAWTRAAAIFSSCLLTALLLAPVEASGQRSGDTGDRGRRGVGSGGGARGGAGIGIRGTLGDRIWSGSLQRRILGLDARRSRSPRSRFFGRRLHVRRSSPSRYRGLAGPRGYTGLGPPEPSGRFDGLRDSRGFSPRAFHGRPWGGGFGLPWALQWTLLAPPTHQVVPPTRGGQPDLDDGESTASGVAPERNRGGRLPPGAGDGSPADCAIVEARYPSGSTTSTWVDFPTAGVSSPGELRALLTEARQAGASGESREAWRSVIPSASSLPEEVSVRPCGTALSTVR